MERFSETLSYPDTPAIQRFDLSGPVIYLPVRHHSPACAFHVGNVIRTVRPVAVLVEGPRDASPLIPLLSHPGTQPPVAVFTTYVRRKGNEMPERFSAYYPICDYSPELAAIRAAYEQGAACEFIDLTFPEMIEARTIESSCETATTKPDNLLAERYTQQSRFIKSACERTGTRDADDLWDHLYELDYRTRKADEFFHNVFVYCALIRNDHTQEMLTVDGTIARETMMRHRIAEFLEQSPKGPIVVVTGGFHTVALRESQPKKIAKYKPMAVPAEDVNVLLIRYGFEQLDRLNGYASGMPSPEFYQRDWENLDIAELIVQIGRLCRRKNFPISTADEIAALHQLERLTALRNHARASREDVCDAIRSVFVKGADDSDGLPILALARKFLAGDRTGNVPVDAGLPPIVLDFNRELKELKLTTEGSDGKEVTLDLYRKKRDRAVSQFFRRLAFLEVPFAVWKRGPDFVRGVNLGRIQEVWNYRWMPETESSLITGSLYGATVREAASALLLERFLKPDDPSLARRADHATRLIVSACLMGLHDLSTELLEKTRTLIVEDHSFASLTGAMELLIGLHVSREPLEARHLSGLDKMATAAYHRACYLIPELAATPESEEDIVIDSLCTLSQAVLSLGDLPEHRELRWSRLKLLAGVPNANPVVQGAAVGMLFGDGEFDSGELLKNLRGSLYGTVGGEEGGTGFLRGLLRTARSVLWQLPECVDLLHELFRDWDEDRFVKQLPLLRLAFASLTPRECDQLAKIVAERTGLTPFTLPRFGDWTEQDMLTAIRINQSTAEQLKRDGLSF